jgi:hypothetical protein
MVTGAPVGSSLAITDMLVPRSMPTTFIAASDCRAYAFPRHLYHL